MSYLEDKIGLIVNIRAQIVKIAQDPIADYLAAMFFVDQIVAYERKLVNLTPRAAQKVPLPVWDQLADFMLSLPSDSKYPPIGFIGALVETSQVAGVPNRKKHRRQLSSWKNKIDIADGRAG